jgi:hypothetical protein
MVEHIDLRMSPFGLVPRLELVSTSPTGTEPYMSRRRYFGHAALAVASTLVLVACSSDTPTSPATASQSLTEAAPTIALSRTGFELAIPSWCNGRTVVRGICWYSSGSLSISNTGGGTLNWTSTKSATWIKRSPTYGTAPSTMKVWEEGTGLPVGTYYGHIKVWATGATNSPQTVKITFHKRYSY